MIKNTLRGHFLHVLQAFQYDAPNIFHSRTSRWKKTRFCWLCVGQSPMQALVREKFCSVKLANKVPFTHLSVGLVHYSVLTLHFGRFSFCGAEIGCPKQLCGLNRIDGFILAFCLFSLKKKSNTAINLVRRDEGLKCHGSLKFQLSTIIKASRKEETKFSKLFARVLLNECRKYHAFSE